MARSPFTLPALREAPPRRLAVPSAGIIALSTVLILIGVLGGSLLSLKGQQQAGIIGGGALRQGSQQVVASTISRLESEQVDLKRSLAEARAQLDQLQTTSAQEKAQLGDITSAIAAEHIGAGLVPLEGQGVIAVFQDSTAPAVPPNEDPNNYILHDYMLRDVLSTLWAGGAEAVSLNGERVLATTSVYCVGTTIICNATRLSPPYEVHAIGNPDALATALQSSSQMQQFNLRAQIYDLPIVIRKEAKVAVPAYTGAFALKFAHPADSSGDAALTPAPPPATAAPVSSPAPATAAPAHAAPTATPTKR